MKPDIHPELRETTYSCACGAEFTSRSTLGGVVKIDVCSRCHPLFSGKEKVVDTEGRIDRFNKKYKLKAVGEAPS